MIDIDNISKHFQSARHRKDAPLLALDKVSFTAQRGRILALLGPNGAGKTTLMRIMAGIEQPSSGQVLVDNRLLEPGKPLPVSMVSDGLGLYPKLTGFENIAFFAELHGLTKVALEQAMVELNVALELEHLLQQATGTMSLGERMRIAIARALIHSPNIIILDEPMNGLDIEAVRRLRSFLSTLAHQQNKCIILSSHQMHEVERVADDVVILVNGKVKAYGTIPYLLARTQKNDFEEAFVQLAFEHDNE